MSVPSEISRSEKIREDIIAECKAVTRQNGYRLDVAAIHRVPIPEEMVSEVVQKAWPVFSVFFGDEVIDFQTVGSREKAPETASLIEVNIRTHVYLAPFVGNVDTDQFDDWLEASLHDVRKVFSNLCLKYGHDTEGRWEILQNEEKPTIERLYNAKEEYALATFKFTVWTIAQGETWQ